ncbi:MAG TPA: archaeal proteasome endopeptidase complex subunit beta [Candidatus Norongarragalinales archaeon]|nr:archaeal proteasome endopeptidase complex subunit beta [Candidatus Norongarragalinales archaeon]
MTDVTSEHRFKGTTTVGVVFRDGVVLCADKRATMSTFIAAKAVDKIHPVSDRMAMTIAGSVGDAQILVRMISAELELYKYSKGGELSVQGAATLLSNVLQGNKYFPYFVQLILAGFDSAPRLFDLDPFGGLIEEKYVSTGSGSITAYGYLDSHFKEGFPEEDAVRLAQHAVQAAIKRDSATGEGVDTIVITRAGIKRLATKPVVA